MSGLASNVLRSRACSRISLEGLAWWLVGVAGIFGAPARGADVAIVAAATNSSITSQRFTDLRDVLVADGRFSTVDIFSTTRFGTGTPSLSELMNYDAIIHWTNDSNEDAVSLGNVLADYVDAGRGVVQAVFANTSTNPDRYLRGRWLDGPYNIIPPMGGTVQGITAGGVLSETAVMSPPLEPDHPVFDGIGDVRLSTGRFTTGGLFGAWRPTQTALEPNARLLAQWEDGKTAIAVSDIFPNRIDLGFHPVSDRVNDGYYDRTSDAGRLIANALLFTATAVDPPLTGDFDGNGIYECADIDVLNSEIVAVAAGAAADLMFDLDGDGSVDAADRDAWLGQAGQAPGSPTSGVPFLNGDSNLDGAVDVSDFNVWNQNKFTTNSSWCAGDFNSDGVVDVSDFGVWNENKFRSASPDAVPEPVTSAGWAVVLWGMLCASRHGRRASSVAG